MDPQAPAIPWYKSPLFRAILVAFALQTISVFHLADRLAGIDVGAAIDWGLSACAILATAGAGLYRWFSSLQKLKLTATAAEEHNVANGIGVSPARAHPIASILAGLMALAVLGGSAGFITGCAGTRAAYSAASSTHDLSTYADVIGEQYYAEVREANRLRDAGAKASTVAALQTADKAVGPLVKDMLTLSKAYKATQSATDQVALQAAMDRAVTALADFIKQVKAASVSLQSSSTVPREIPEGVLS